MSPFNSRPLVGGTLRGVRGWFVDSYNRGDGLISPSFSYTWQPGENLAECKMVIPPSMDFHRSFEAWQVEHHIAHIDCSCGFYAYHAAELNPQEEQWRHYGYLHGIIEGYGKATVGTRGFRVAKARVLCLFKPESSLVSSLIHYGIYLRDILRPDAYEVLPEREALAKYPLSVISDDMLADEPRKAYEPSWWRR